MVRLTQPRCHYCNRVLIRSHIPSIFRCDNPLCLVVFTSFLVGEKIYRPSTPEQQQPEGA